MDIEERIKDLEILNKSIEFKINELKEELEEKKRQEEAEKLKPWKPGHEEQYWYLDDSGQIEKDVFDELSSYHKGGLEIGNAYKTREEVKFMRERLRVIAELKPFARPFKLDKENYFMYFSHADNKTIITDTVLCQRNDLYFESEEIAQKAIKAVGEERIKKYYLGVKEI